LSLRAYALAALLTFGALVLTNVAFQTKQIERKLNEKVGAADRFVDIGITIKQVVSDPDGEILVPEKPPLRVVGEPWHLGGVVDTKLKKPAIVAPSQFWNVRVWYVSTDQWNALRHEDTEKLGQLIYGSEGAGKTRLLAMWHYVRWVHVIGQKREGGQTAPVADRLEMVLREMLAIWPASWFTYTSSKERFRMCDGTRIQLVSTYRQSAAQGSPVQGYNWSWCGRDEMQDQLDVHEDIESRGRSAESGHYWQLATATAKDSAEWRTLRTSLVQSGKWLKRDLSIFRSPFVTRRFIEDRRASFTDREFRRRYGNPETGVVEDLAPELQLYFGWSRARNLRPIPITAKKITSIVLSKKTGNRLHALLAGHDPGSLKGATIYLDAYQVPKCPDPVWWVRGERMHRRQTTEQSGKEILADAVKRGCNVRPDGEIVHVRAMPVGQSEDKPSDDLYRIFRRVGLDVRAAQFRKDGTGTGVIKKDDRIELLNWLFETGRLCVECDDLGRPVAPNLVTALESMERDDKGRAEWERKDGDDLSDCPAALGYALWPFEKASASGLQAEIRRGIV
jgi:hypothetical protein